MLPKPRPTLLKQSRWKAAREQYQQGVSIRGLARRLGMSRRTVRKYLLTDRPPTYSPRRPSRTKLTPCLDCLSNVGAKGVITPASSTENWYSWATGTLKAWSGIPGDPHTVAVDQPRRLHP